MQSENWFGRLWTRLWSGVVEEVPASLEECETCREVDCTQERWLRCEKRLTTEAASLADNAPGRTDELLPRVLPAPPTASYDALTEEAVAPARTRKISSH